MKHQRLPATIVAAIDKAKILGVRAGSRADHRFTGIWPVVVDGRVFARSWTLTPEGWHAAFLKDPQGTLEVGRRRVRVRAVRVRGTRLNAAVERAYAAKYFTPASRKYVVGFRSPKRRKTTTEFIPR